MITAFFTEVNVAIPTFTCDNETIKQFIIH